MPLLPEYKDEFLQKLLAVVEDNYYMLDKNSNTVVEIEVCFGKVKIEEFEFIEYTGN